MNRRIFFWRIGITFLLVLSLACSKDPAGGDDGKTPQQLVNEGWTAFESGDYTTAATRFNEALAQDNSLGEAHHGQGWVQARLGNPGEAVNHFLNAISQNAAVPSATAGLAFIYNAQMQYANSNQRAGEVLSQNAQWVFEHDSRVDWRDLVILRAENYFALGQFAESLQEVKKLNSAFDSDVSTTAGQAELAAEIERLVGVYF
ncbi:MAG: hypothetical protein Kow0037_32460 [Calditrichia bacterium]